MAGVSLGKLKNADKSTIDRVDITEVKIYMSAPVEARVKQYIEQIKNPYFFKCGDVAVNVIFSSNGRTLKQAITAYLITKKIHKY